MRKSEYWQNAFNAFSEGRIDEDTFDAMIMNEDIFCDEDGEEEEAQADLDADTYAELWNDLVEEMKEE